MTKFLKLVQMNSDMHGLRMNSMNSIFNLWAVPAPPFERFRDSFCVLDGTRDLMRPYQTKARKVKRKISTNKAEPKPNRMLNSLWLVGQKKHENIRVKPTNH